MARLEGIYRVVSSRTKGPEQKIMRSFSLASRLAPTKDVGRRRLCSGKRKGHPATGRPFLKGESFRRRFRQNFSEPNFMSRKE